MLGLPKDYVSPELQRFLNTFWSMWTQPDPNTGQKRTLEKAVEAAKKAGNDGNPYMPIGLGFKPQIWGAKDLLFDQAQ